MLSGAWFLLWFLLGMLVGLVLITSVATAVYIYYGDVEEVQDDGHKSGDA